MTKAKQGDKVKIHYYGTLEDGTIFDSSYERDPLEFTLGDGQIISGLDEAVQGMSEGETKQVAVSSNNAFGEYLEENIIQVARSNLPEDVEPQIGMTLKLNTPDNQIFYARIADLDEENLTLDGNHPLAGQDLNFELKLVELQQSS